MGVEYWNGWYKVQDTTDCDSGYSNDYDWVLDTMGLPNVNGRWWYDYISQVYYFKNKNDALMYQIGWQNATMSR